MLSHSSEVISSLLNSVRTATKSTPLFLKESTFFFNISEGGKNFRPATLSFVVRFGVSTGASPIKQNSPKETNWQHYFQTMLLKP